MDVNEILPQVEAVVSSENKDDILDKFHIIV